MEGILQSSAPCSLGDLPGPQFPLLVGMRRRQAGQEPVCCLARSGPLSVRLSYLKVSAESQSLRAGSTTGPSGDPTKLRMAAGTRGPKPPGRGALCFVAGAGEPETRPFCYCESSLGHYTLLSHNNAAMSWPRGGHTRLPWRRRRYPGAGPMCAGGTRLPLTVPLGV